MVDFDVCCLLDFWGLSDIEVGLLGNVRDLTGCLGVLVS